MSISDGVVAGAFALGGVVIQYFLSALSAQRQWRRQEEADHRRQKRDLYAEILLQARRVQRGLKEISEGFGTDQLRQNLRAELNHLAELNALLRLTVPTSVSRESLALEEEMRRRLNTPEVDHGPLPLAPLISVFRADVDLMRDGMTEE